MKFKFRNFFYDEINSFLQPKESLILMIILEKWMANFDLITRETLIKENKQLLLFLLIPRSNPKKQSF